MVLNRKIIFYFYCVLVCVALLFTFTVESVRADEVMNGDVLYPKLPRLELGIGLGAYYSPDYPGSDEMTFRSLPFPYVIYRGDFIKADRDGNLRGQFLKGDKLDFDVSFGGGFPTSSAANKARKGMPELDWMGEFGPRAIVHLYKGGMVRLDLHLPLRFAYTIEAWEFQGIGYVFQPQLRFNHRAIFDDRSIFAAGIGPVFTTDGMMDYFYEVAPRYATTKRPTYNAEGGLMAVNTNLFFIRRFNDKWIGFTGVSRNFYGEAKNRSSPLLRDIETETYVAGLAWGIYASDETVAAGVSQ